MVNITAFPPGNYALYHHFKKTVKQYHWKGKNGVANYKSSQILFLDLSKFNFMYAKNGLYAAGSRFITG